MVKEKGTVSEPASVPEKSESARTEIKEICREQLNGGAVTVKHGKFGYFVDLGKKNGGVKADGKPDWDNIRLKGFEAEAVAKMIVKYQALVAKEEMEIPSA